MKPSNRYRVAVALAFTLVIVATTFAATAGGLVCPPGRFNHTCPTR